MALAAGMRGAGLEAEEFPVADGGERTAEVFAAALGGEWRTAPASDPLGRVVEARYLVLEDGSAVVEAAEVVGLRSARAGRARPARGLEPRPWRGARGDRGRGLGIDPRRARRHGDGRRRSRVARSHRRIAERPRRCRFSVTYAIRCSGSEAPRARSGRRRAPLRSRWTSSRRGSPRCRSWAPTPSCPAPARPVAWARRSRRSEGGSSRARPSCSSGSTSRARLGLADLVVTGEGTLDRSSTEGKAVGEVVKVCRELGVRCELFGGRVDEPPPGTQPHALSGDPNRAADDLVELGGRVSPRAARRRVAASPSSGASSTRASGCSRRAAGTPTT